MIEKDSRFRDSLLKLLFEGFDLGASREIGFDFVSHATQGVDYSPMDATELAADGSFGRDGMFNRQVNSEPPGPNDVPLPGSAVNKPHLDISAFGDESLCVVANLGCLAGIDRSAIAPSCLWIR